MKVSHSVGMAGNMAERVLVKGKWSKTTGVLSGVPEGGIVSPLFLRVLHK